MTDRNSLPRVLVAVSMAAVAGAAVGAAEESAGYQLEEIIVTAQRRSEYIQKSALAITAVSGETLARRGADSAQNLQLVVPGLQVTPDGNTTNFTIRGVTNDFTGESATLSIAYGQDGVFISRPDATSTLMFDVERVEVLRGPQGSLSGTNAAAGSIMVLSKRPTRQLEGSGAIEFGNYDALKTQGALNLPLSDTVAVRGSFATASHDGYYNNGVAVARASQDDKAGRLRILFTPTENLSILVGGQYNQGKGVPFERPICYTADGAHGCPFNGDPYTYALSGNALPTNDHKSYAAMTHIDWTLPVGTLTYIGAYNEDTQEGTNYTGYAFLNPAPDISAGAAVADPVQGSERLKYQRSHELRLADSSDALSWVLGWYYVDENNYFADVPNPDATGFAVAASGQQSGDSRAVFGQATYSLTDAFRVTAGARYTRDYKFENLDVCLGFTLPFTPADCAPSSSAVSWHYGTYRAGVEYDLASDSMLYATVSTGLKPGGYNNDRVDPAVRYFDAEKIVNYEIGVKNRFLDARLQLNATVFLYDYKDRQVTYDFAPGLGGTVNAAKASNRGVELDAIWLATAADRLSFSANYLDAAFDDFKIRAFVSSGYQDVDYTGANLARSPEWILNGAYQHLFTLANQATLTPRLDVHYEADQKLGYQPFPILEEGAFTNVDATLTYAAADDKYRIIGFVRNATDEIRRVSADRVGFGSSFEPFVRGTAVLSDPRTYGIRLEVDFL